MWDAWDADPVGGCGFVPAYQIPRYSSLQVRSAGAWLSLPDVQEPSLFLGGPCDIQETWNACAPRLSALLW